MPFSVSIRTRPTRMPAALLATLALAAAVAAAVAGPASGAAAGVGRAAAVRIEAVPDALTCGACDVGF